MAELTLDRAWPDVFTPAEGRALSAVQGPPQIWRARQRLIRADIPLSDSLYLTEGFLGRYRADRLGRRQFLGLQIPGDYVDLPAYALGHLDHDIDAISDAVVRHTPHDRIRALRSQAPDTFQKLWRISLIDASIHRYWIFRVGRLAGRARIANFLCEMLLRLYSRGLCPIDGFELPLTQIDLAEICGMTSVHANRMVAELRAEGICTFAQGEVRVTQLARMFRAAQFSTDYLYLPAEVERELAARLGDAAPGGNRALPDPGTRTSAAGQ
ncbi:MAG TPA: Crp/Fnr family transcriptional regulator [Paracoccus sp. (in: a-proteobacteria)]|nr:Crp/Fnr family transcriptional regulator [Paracoccus sp. (in: a-proteobacteria)]